MANFSATREASKKMANVRVKLSNQITHNDGKEALLRTLAGIQHISPGYSTSPATNTQRRWRKLSVFWQAQLFKNTEVLIVYLQVQGGATQL